MENMSQLNPVENLLLKKMIFFSSLQVDTDDDPIKQQLYNLFFEWKYDAQ